MWPFSKVRLRVVVVCTANVCRSPAAEAVLRHYLNIAGIGRRVSVVSAGTAVASPGRPPDPRVVASLTERGIKTRGLKSKPLAEKVLNTATHLWVMESSHVDEICKAFPNLAARPELLDPDRVGVPDPYYGNREGINNMVLKMDAIGERRAAQLADALERLSS